MDDTPRMNIKKQGTRKLPLTTGLGGTFNVKLSCALACPAHLGQNITRTDNHYTTLKHPSKRVSKFVVRYKELFTLYKLCPSAMPNSVKIPLALFLQLFVPERLVSLQYNQHCVMLTLQSVGKYSNNYSSIHYSGMYFWKNLRNFVDMKTSIDFLPEFVQDDLHELVGLIREEIKDVVMIILYGSYAKNTYVIHDVRIGPNGETTEYHSDYDIMVVTRKRLGERESTIETRIRDRFAADKSEVTKVQLIGESITKLNNALSQGHYFYIDAVNEGILLYDSGECELATPRDLNFSGIKQIAESYFYSNQQRALDYWEDAIRNINNKKYTHSSFFLHQATEYLLKSIPLVFILYRYKEHELKFLLDMCKKHTLDLVDIFPCRTKQEEQAFDLLCRAYVEARYNDNFVVTKEEIDVLVPRIELLIQTVEKVCRERIAFYDSQIKK